MRVKKTSKNRITIPKEILDQLPDVSCFDVEWKAGVIVLTPVKLYPAGLEGIRAKVKKLGISERSVADAVTWARKK
jgi:predicted DNA-binding protein (UPF0251 family)